MPASSRVSRSASLWLISLNHRPLFAIRTSAINLSLYYHYPKRVSWLEGSTSMTTAIYTIIYVKLFPAVPRSLSCYRFSVWLGTNEPLTMRHLVLQQRSLIMGCLTTSAP